MRVPWTVVAYVFGWLGGALFATGVCLTATVSDRFGPMIIAGATCSLLLAGGSSSLKD